MASLSDIFYVRQRLELLLVIMLKLMSQSKKAQ